MGQAAGTAPHCGPRRWSGDLSYHRHLLPENRAGVSDGVRILHGKLEAAVVLQKKHPNIFRKIRAFFSLAHLFLLGYKVRARLITRLEGSHFEVRTDDAVVWNFDGEKGVSGNVVIDVLPRKINMIVPKKRNDF